MNCCPFYVTNAFITYPISDSHLIMFFGGVQVSANGSETLFCDDFGCIVREGGLDYIADCLRVQCCVQDITTNETDILYAREWGHL